MNLILKYLKKILFVSGLAWVLWGATGEFYQIAWGSGDWMGEFSRTWAILYYTFIFACVAFFALSVYFVWKQEIILKNIDRLIKFRGGLGISRWILWAVVFIAPIWFFQFTVWGVVLQKFYIRIIIWIIVVCLLAILASNKDCIIGWRQFLSMLILTACLFSISASLKLVNSYPFSQGWSEGNRLWDYSVLFGHDRYLVPPGKAIPVLLDFGRQFIGGLPFLIPGITIRMARLWVGLTQIIPYILLGFALFRTAARNKLSWLLLTLWSFLFLNQGPIHPPLVLCAALVALAWQAPFWYAAPLVIVAGYFAETSRFTWLFAPGIWIFMLEFASAKFSDRKSAAPVLKRAILLAVLGIFGGLFLPNLLAGPQSLVQQLINPTVLSSPVAVATTPALEDPTIVPSLEDGTKNPYPQFFNIAINILTIQPLLWYRLLPNSTYGNGILFALLLAVGPLIVILFALILNNVWQINRLQKISILLSLFAFFLVGLVASVKIGGGGDLHNMDMFLIGLLFTGSIAWKNGAGNWLLNGSMIPDFIKGVIVFSLINSALGPLQEVRSYEFGQYAAWIKTLTDVSNEGALDMLPSQQHVDLAIQTIQENVDAAGLQGEVLFMDQRQLLTFGYISGVEFVPEYEKKLLMNQAMSEDSQYFIQFYADLAAHRFSLIISDPLRTPIKDSSFQFGEENNAWVKWVSNPVLCYYEVKDTLKEVGVQLLVPKSEPVDCATQLPSGKSQ